MIYKKSECPLCFDKKKLFAKSCRNNIKSHYICSLCYCKMKNYYGKRNLCIYCGERPSDNRNRNRNRNRHRNRNRK